MAEKILPLQTLFVYSPSESQSFRRLRPYISVITDTIMTIFLHIEYQTQWGAQLYVTTGKKPAIGSKLPNNAIEMDNDGRGNWFVEVEAERLNNQHYHYVLAYQRHVLRNEFGNGHLIADISESNGVPTLHVWDIWRRLPQIRSFFSLAFRRRHEIQQLYNTAHPLVDELAPNRMTMVCEAGKLQDDWQLALIGNTDVLGNWNPALSLPMEQVSRGIWSVSFDRSAIRFPLRYKFVVLERLTHRFIGWEDCTNRFFQPSMMELGDSLLICDQRFTRLAQDKDENPQETTE